MNKIITTSVLLIAGAVFYYLVIFQPSIQKEKLNQEAQIQYLKQQQLEREVLKEQQRDEQYYQCQITAKQNTINYIKNLQYPNKVPNSIEMIQRLTAECMRNYGY